MSTVKRFRKCADPCQRYLTLDDAHDLCVVCLGEEHARSVLEGTECVHCERVSSRGLLSDPNPRVPKYFRVSGRVSG